jgi:hypothetical protein
MPGYHPPNMRRHHRVGGPILPTFVTCKDAKDLKEQINSAVISTSAVVYACPATAQDPAFTSAWAAFLEAWNTFYQDECGWNAASQVDRAQNFQAQLADWQAKLQSKGCTLSAPLIQKDPGTMSATDWASALKIAGYAAIAIAGAVVVVEVASLFKGGAHE